MTCFTDIPSDLFINIYKNINLLDVDKITSVSNTFYCQKKEIIKNIIDSNVFVQKYSNISTDNIIYNIEKSYFTFNTFQKILDGICNKDRNAISIKFTNVETSTESIDSTFKIFQLFKKYSIVIYEESKMQFGSIITELLLDYFDELFKKRIGLDTLKKSIIMFTFHNSDCMWHNININPYYICENLNIKLNFHNSPKFRKNVKNRISIRMDDTYKNQQETFEYFIKICNNESDNMIYVFYELIKYLNDINHHINLHKIIIKSILSKTKDFRDKITNNNFKKYKIDFFMKKAVLEEFDIFIDNNKN